MPQLRSDSDILLSLITEADISCCDSPMGQIYSAAPKLACSQLMSLLLPSNRLSVSIRSSLAEFQRAGIIVSTCCNVYGASSARYPVLYMVIYLVKLLYFTARSFRRFISISRPWYFYVFYVKFPAFRNKCLLRYKLHVSNDRRRI